MAFWRVDQFDAAAFKRLGKLDEEGGLIIAEAFNALQLLWDTCLNTNEDDEIELVARTVADVGYRLRRAAVDLGLLTAWSIDGKPNPRSRYLEAGPLLHHAGDVIASCRFLLEHHRGPGPWSFDQPKAGAA